MLAASYTWLVSSHREAPSPPPEQLLQIVQLQLHIGRSAVVALAGVGGGFHLAEEGVHFGGREDAA